MATVQEQLANIRSQAERIQGGIRTIGEAESRGYRGGNRMSVQGAERFLGRPVSTPTAITPLDLTGSATPLVTPPAPPTSQAGAFIQSTQDSVDQRAKDYAASIIDQNKTSELKATDKTFREKIAELLGGPGQTERTDKAYSRSVDPAKKELDDIQNQIRAKTLAARRQAEEIQKNKQGLFGGAVEQEVNRVNRENARELADLSIIEQAKLTNYSTAKEIADRKVAIETEQQKNELDAYKFFYAENKADLTKAEDRQFTLMINERERLLNEETATKKTINDIVLNALQNGAPNSLAQQALKSSSVESIIPLLGGYVGRLDKIYKQKQIDYLDSQILEKNNDLLSGNLTDTEIKAIDTSPQGKKMTTLSDLKTSAMAYQALVNQYGLQQTGAGRTLLENAYAELQIKWKEAANLGALTGPDLQLIQDSVKPATGFRAAQTALTGGGAAGIISGINQMLNRIDVDAARSYSELLSRNFKYKDSGYVTGLSLPFFSQYKSQLQSGEILVRDIDSGTIGAIPESEFNSNKYQRI